MVEAYREKAQRKGKVSEEEDDEDGEVARRLKHAAPVSEYVRFVWRVGHTLTVPPLPAQARALARVACLVVVMLSISDLEQLFGA